jgi:hypothetical protein
VTHALPVQCSQRIAMTLTRMHAAGTPLAVATRLYTTLEHNWRTTTNSLLMVRNGASLRYAAHPFLS